MLPFGTKPGTAETTALRETSLYDRTLQHDYKKVKAEVSQPTLCHDSAEMHLNTNAMNDFQALDRAG